MDGWVVVLFIVAVIAVIWYLRKQSAQDAERRKVDEIRRLQAAASESERAERASLAASSQAIGEDIPASTRGGGLFQEAAEAASGAPYERAADRLDEMSADLERAKHDADRAADRLAGRAREAMASVQAAAATHGGAIPGDGTPNCPSSYPVKGAMSSMTFYEPGSRLYNRTIPDVCFQGVAAAEAAGFSVDGDEAGTGGAMVVDDVEAVVVADPERDQLEVVVAEAIQIRDREDVERIDVGAEAIAAADAGGVPPGAVRGDGSRDCPPAYPIKGNRSSMLYHEPGTPTYGPTVPEFCFSRVDSAVAAGFSPARR